MAPLLDRMPPQALSHWVLTAGHVAVARALSWGLIGETCPRAQLDTRVQELTDRLLTFPDAAVLAVKRYLNQATRQDVRTAAQEGAQMLAQVLSTR